MLVSKNGRIATITGASGNRAMPAQTNRQTPTGGVVSPIIRFSTATVAKCSGSIPTAFDSASKGTNRMIRAAMVSRNMPTHSSRMLISSSTRNLLSVIDRTASAMACGIRSDTRIQPNTLAKPTSARMPAADTALSTTMRGTAGMGSSR